MRASEIRELSDAEIQERITQAREELFRLRFRSATQQLENPALIKSLRRDVARLQTVLREREQNAASATAGASSTNTNTKTKPRARTRTH